MPTCASNGRANHDLLAKTCGLCNCVTDTYRCNPKCCPKEPRDNNRFTIDDLKRIICTTISLRLSSMQSGGLAGVASEICTYTYPNFNCEVPIYVQLASEPESELLPVATIVNGGCIDISTSTDPTSNEYVLLVDNVECLMLTFS